MPATILTKQDANHTYIYFNGIRGLIAPDVTDKQISDAYLLQIGFAPEAERKVRKRLTAENVDVDTLTGDRLADAVLAMMHECAAVLCLTAPQQLRQTLIQVVTEVQNIDWKEKRQFHLGEADALLTDIIAAAATPGSSGAARRKRRHPFGAVGTGRRP